MYANFTSHCQCTFHMISIHMISIFQQHWTYLCSTVTCLSHHSQQLTWGAGYVGLQCGRHAGRQHVENILSLIETNINMTCNTTRSRHSQEQRREQLRTNLCSIVACLSYSYQHCKDTGTYLKTYIWNCPWAFSTSLVTHNMLDSNAHACPKRRFLWQGSKHCRAQRKLSDCPSAFQWKLPRKLINDKTVFLGKRHFLVSLRFPTQIWSSP